MKPKFFGALAAAVLVLAGCANTNPVPPHSTSNPAPSTSTATNPATNPAADLQPLTIGLTYIPNAQFAPFYLAHTQGYFEQAGLDVTLRHHGESEDVFGAVLDGTEDVVVSGGTEVLQARAGGSKLQSIATLYQTYPVSLVVPEDSEIDSPADLVGHSLGIPGAFGDSYLGMLAMFEEYGLSEDSVDVQSIGFTGQQALANGHVDAVMAFSNNEPVLLETSGFGVRVIRWDHVPLVGSGLATRESIVNDADQLSSPAVRPDHIEAMLQAVGAAIDDLFVDPDLGVDAAIEFIPGTVDAQSREVMKQVLVATIELYAPSGAPWGISDEQLWSQMNDFMFESGITPQSVSVDDVMTNELFSNQ